MQQRIAEVAANDTKKGWGERADLKAQIRAEKCARPELVPQHTFVGRLEVDGMPIDAAMTLREIQARRQQLGLPALQMAPVGGARFYNGFPDPKQPGLGQTWEFEWPPNNDTPPQELRLKLIRVP